MLHFKPNTVFCSHSLRIRSEAIIRNTTDDIVRPSAMARHEDTIDAGIALRSVDASAALVEG